MPDDTATRQLPPEAARFAAIIHDHLPDLGERYGVASLALFGSYVRGEQHEGSDLDVLVEFDRPIGLGIVTLQDELSNLLGIRVDLAVQTALRRRIGAMILREAVPV